jgi:hypothetical protein
VKKHPARRPLPDLKVHRCALGLPHRIPTAVGALAGDEVWPRDANKRVGSSIGLTRGRLATEARPGNNPVMAGGEATVAPPRWWGSRQMWGELSHKWSGRLWWTFGKVARGSVRPGSKRRSRLTTTALMVTAAGGVFSGARKEWPGRGFYRPGASQETSPERHAYRNHGMGGKAVGDVQRASGQWRMAVRPRACARRPRVAGLGVGGVSRL